MAAQKTKRGRAPSVDRVQIVKAVRAVARRGPLSMQTVADQLNVDVTTLYRHVGNVEELRRIGATLAAPQTKAWPDHCGETWESWVIAMAQYYRVAMRENPDLIEYAAAALDPNFDGLDRATEILVEFGFEPRSAVWAHSFLINQVVGFVHQELRDQEDAVRGDPATVRLFRALENGKSEDRLKTLRGIDFRPKDFDGEAMFDLFLRYVVEGIRGQSGAPSSGKRKRSR